MAVARALINHPAVVLADEPSGSLDTHNKEELHQLFFDLRNRFGQTFVIVTHDEGLAQLTDRTIHLIDGEINKMVWAYFPVPITPESLSLLFTFRCAVLKLRPNEKL